MAFPDRKLSFYIHVIDLDSYNVDLKQNNGTTALQYDI